MPTRRTPARPVSHVVLSSNTAWSLSRIRGGVAAAFVRAGYRVTALAPTDPLHSAELESIGVELAEIPVAAHSLNPIRDGMLLSRYWRAYRALAPDLVFHFTIKPAIYGSLACGALGIPSVTVVQGLGSGLLKGGVVTAVAQALYGLSQRSVRLVAFENGDDAKYMLEKGLVQPTQLRRLSGCGIDIGHFAPAPLPERSDTTFLFIGRLIKDKGVLEFVEAVKYLRLHQPGVRAQLMGPLESGSPAAISQAAIDRWVADGVVKYLGASTDVRPAIAAADCVVLPSYREGTGRVLLEAGSMERPVIATDVAGCREVVVDGYNGFLCRARDPSDLRDKMVRFLNLPPSARREMGTRGRERAGSRFSERAVIAEFLSLAEDARS
jgi:glycosyltransferase involved in cell wall biosynthesis